MIVCTILLNHGKEISLLINKTIILANNHHSVDSYESHESMDIDINESNSEIIVDEDFLSYHKSLSNQDNSGMCIITLS